MRFNQVIFIEPSEFSWYWYKIEKDKIVIGEGDQWLEVLCGMVHPNVLKNVKVDTKKIRDLLSEWVLMFSNVKI